LRAGFAQVVEEAISVYWAFVLSIRLALKAHCGQARPTS